MTDTEIMPAPNVTPPSRPVNKLDLEKAAFYRLLPTLLPDYRNKYVAIHDEQVVASGDELAPVALAAYDRCGYQAIYVDLVTDAPAHPVRIPQYKPMSSRSSA